MENEKKVIQEGSLENVHSHEYDEAESKGMHR